MIVYPDYIHYKEKGPTANPIIFDLNSVNYPYTTTPGAAYMPQYGGMYIPNGKSVSITIPVKGFKQIRFSMTSESRRSSQAVFSMPPGKNPSGTVPVISQMEYVYQIPKDLQTETATFKIEKPFDDSGAYLGALIVSSAILE